MTTSPRSAPQADGPGVLAAVAMTAALVAAAGIIAVLCLGLASPAGAATAALACALACAAVTLAMAVCATRYPARPPLPGASGAGGRQRGPRSWEIDTLDENDWARWEREVSGPPAPGTIAPHGPDGRPLPPPAGPLTRPDDHPGGSDAG